MARVFRAKRKTDAARIALIAVIVIAVLLALWYGIGAFHEGHHKRDLAFAKDAVVRATVQCYALEGRYPQSLNYLTERYGLMLDENKYVYYYRAIGENLMPEIRVFPL
ncbi:MAG: hypothetical protein LBC58_01740 [Clostridiales Family XIII bacterium]|jgi:hypothetical protein|nr:hypothetical protein [Clostridiales Family XIII bacterium]